MTWRRIGDDSSWSTSDRLTAEDMQRIADAEDGKCIPISLPAVQAAEKPCESEAVRCFLKNMYRIKRALENDEGWTISEARVPGWLAGDLRRHPWLRRSDRRWCESRQVFQVGDEICRFVGVPLVVGTDRIEFSYKKVA